MIRFDTAILRRARRAVLVLAAAATLATVGVGTGVRAQERVAIAGTTVSLAPLKGFSPSSKFAGLENVEAKASVLVVEMPPEAHQPLSALFADLAVAKPNFAKQNITLDSAADIETAGGKGRILTGRQALGSATFDKWIVLLQGAKTVMVTVQAPQNADLRGQQVLSMLKTVSLGAEPTLDQKLAALPFRVRAADPFRIVDTFGGLGVLMTVGALNTDPGGSQPMLIVSYQTSGQVGAGQLAATGEKLLQTTRGFEKAEITRRETIRFAGSDTGALLSGTVVEGPSRKRFSQYIGQGPDGRFVRMIVSAGETAYPALEPAIATIADSISFAK